MDRQATDPTVPEIEPYQEDELDDLFARLEGEEEDEEDDE